MNSGYDLKGKFNYGMHACGMIHEIMFTNSFDAFDYWYHQGIRIFEVDVDVALDGKLVLCHNFNEATFEKMQIILSDDEYTSEWFSKQKSYSKTVSGGLTLLSLDQMFALMSSYGDLLLMIDPKKYTFADTCHFLTEIERLLLKYEIVGNRVFFETYNLDMIKATSQFPGLVIYQHCIDDEIQMGNSAEFRQKSIEEQIKVLREYHFESISYPWKFAVEKLYSLNLLRKENFIVFSKTRNDIFHELVEMAGVNVNLVDCLLDSQGTAKLKEYYEYYMKKYKDRIERSL